ncbi:hypothetical protein D9613_012386 [Agrocybe pediades]|uniref:Uncharacterized protein n=1 Tax=Agrocybe pediades TaxID=84607 RepID=A0A8H4QRX6_9AGAR|nr:hypothetical protein D9613_012386 [Agrocybe pediades]
MRNPVKNLDLSAFTWHAFSREAMFDKRWYLRSERLVVYTATMLMGMAAQGAATYCMFKYKFLRQHIGNFSGHAAHVHEIDIMAGTILSMIFPCLVVLFLNVEYTLLLFWPGRLWPSWYNNWFRKWYMLSATLGMLATIVSSTVIVATRSASIMGVDAITAKQLTDLYFRPPLEYCLAGADVDYNAIEYSQIALSRDGVMTRITPTLSAQEDNSSSVAEGADIPSIEEEKAPVTITMN